MTLLIIIAGNVSDGLTFFGPFYTFDEADEFAQTKLVSIDTWIAPLTLNPKDVKA